MKILGLDYGSRTTGIAISDETGSIAFPVETVVREEEIALKQTVRRIRQLTDENNIHTVVLGFPKNMDNSLGERAEKTLAFKKRLERDLYQVEIVLWDERLSTVASERPLLEMGYDRHRRKKIVDNMAAAYILQGYLDAQKAGGNADNG
ncbi:MAG: Holliday junction resolvase RuvX [Firmicutes bacterium]|nr:Holliday junction resolvase RuvX [Bacillota bacterium]